MLITAEGPHHHLLFLPFFVYSYYTFLYSLLCSHTRLLLALSSWEEETDNHPGSQVLHHHHPHLRPDKFFSSSLDTPPPPAQANLLTSNPPPPPPAKERKTREPDEWIICFSWRSSSQTCEINCVWSVTTVPWKCPFKLKNTTI